MNHIAKIRARLADYGLDSVLILSSVNMQYACGYRTGDSAVLISAEKAYYFADSRNIESARRGTENMEMVLCTQGKGLYDAVAEKAELCALRRIGIEEGKISILVLDRLQAALGDRIKYAEALFNDVRSSKNAEEKAKLIEAQRLTEQAYENTLRELKVGMTERQVSAILTFHMLNLGAERISFGPIVGAGEKTSLPHSRPSDKVICTGDFLTMDFGCVVDGWCSDMTRTVAFGSVTEEMRRIYSCVLDAQLAGIAAAKAGIPGKEVDAASRKVITDAGYGEYFTHSFGHGMGMEGHEGIGATKTEDRLLPVGAVISAEPGIYIPNRYGVRIEDVLYVTENGCEDITLTPKELLIL